MWKNLPFCLFCLKEETAAGFQMSLLTEKNSRTVGKIRKHEKKKLFEGFEEITRQE